MFQVMFLFPASPDGWVLKVNPLKMKKFPGRARSCWWLDCLPFFSEIVAKIIFYSHLPAMEGLKTGRNEKRYFRNRRHNKKHMQINILPSGICKQVLTEWLLKKLGRSPSQSSCPNSRCSKMDGQMIKWQLNRNSLGSTEAWPLVPFFATFFPDSVYVIPWCDKEGMREIHFCFTIAALPAHGCGFSCFLQGRVDQLRMLQALLIASTCWVWSLGCESY